MQKKLFINSFQAECSKAAYVSWKNKSIQSSENKTFAGGFATGTAYSIPFDIYKEELTDFVTLSEEEIKEGMILSLKHTRNLAEGAGAAPIMAAFKLKKQLEGKKVVLQMSGCNTDLSILKEIVGRL